MARLEKALAWPVTLDPAEEGGFVVNFLDFPEGWSQGDSREEALAQAADLLETMVANYMAEGWDLPDPSRAAGRPLVNLALLIMLSVVGVLNRSLGWAETMPNAHALLRSVWLINLGLLVFNMLPIYPLDGGQILRSLLWFAVGRARSLMVTTIIGFVGVAGFIILALRMQSVWFGVLSVFVLTNCWRGLRQAQALSRILESPRRDGFTCPSCNAAPPVGNYWMCAECSKQFDTFQTQAVCPNCAAQFGVTACLDCGKLRPMSEWIVPAAPQPLLS